MMCSGLAAAFLKGHPTTKHWLQPTIPFQEECAEETLLSLSEEGLLSLPGVRGKHQDAKNQASRYLSSHSKEEKIIAFAVTEVGNCRYLVDEVTLPNLNP